jgi:hypothetical protein
VRMVSFGVKLLVRMKRNAVFSEIAQIISQKSKCECRRDYRPQVTRLPFIASGVS